MFHEMPLKLYFMKYVERKVSQCILALWKSLKLLEEESKIICSQSGMQIKNAIVNTFFFLTF